MVVRDENGLETSIKLRTDANGKPLRTSNIILATGSVQSPAILLRSGKKNFLESNGGLHLTDHHIFAKGCSFRYLNLGDREQIGSMKIQTYVRLGDDVADGNIALVNFSIDADSFLPKSFMPNLRNLTKEAMQVLQKALSIEIHGTKEDKDESFFKPLGLGGVTHELGTIPMPGRPNKPYCLEADFKLRGHKGTYVCDLSVFPYSPEVNPTLALAALALALPLSRTRILPRLPIAAKDDNNVYVMNQTGDKVQVFISNSAGVNIQEWEKKRQSLEPGDYAQRKRKYGVLESVMVYKLDYDSIEEFVPEPTVYVARPGEILTI